MWRCTSIFSLCQTLDFRNASVWERKWQEGEWERKWTTATTKRRAWRISPSDKQTFFTPVRGRSFACCTFCEWASFSGTFCNNALKMKTSLLQAVCISFTLHFLKIPNHFMFRCVLSFLAIWTAIYISVEFCPSDSGTSPAQPYCSIQQLSILKTSTMPGRLISYGCLKATWSFQWMAFIVERVLAWFSVCLCTCAESWWWGTDAFSSASVSEFSSWPDQAVCTALYGSPASGFVVQWIIQTLHFSRHSQSSEVLRDIIIFHICTCSVKQQHIHCCM